MKIANSHVKFKASCMISTNLLAKLVSSTGFPFASSVKSVSSLNCLSCYRYVHKINSFFNQILKSMDSPLPQVAKEAHAD